jgi:hypothetical protein
VAARGGAQQPAMPVVGFMNINTSAESVPDLLAAFRQGLKETGFVEGQNVALFVGLRAHSHDARRGHQLAQYLNPLRRDLWYIIGRQRAA